jgi:hypothetical protein
MQPPQCISVGHHAQGFVTTLAGMQMVHHTSLYKQWVKQRGEKLVSLFTHCALWGTAYIS